MASPQPTILIVDDSLVQRVSLRATLRSAGFDVREAATGREALRQAAEGGLGLMLLDVVLPDLPGYEVCRQLKADPATAPVPVILVSALGVESKERVQGLDCGADGYLTKPAEPTELVAHVRALLRARQAEEALRQSEQQYRLLTETIPHLVWVLDPAGDCLFHNERCREYAGLPDDADWDWRDLVHPDDRANALAAWERAVGEGAPAAAEYRARRADGAYRWHMLRALPLRAAGGAVVRWFATSTDIDGQKQAEETLRTADRRKDEFLATLAHELRNPLAPISNAVHVMKLVGPGDPHALRARDLIERQVGHMARLVEDLMDVSRVAAGKLSLRLESIDLTAVVGRAVETSRPLIEARRHNLTLHLNDRSVRVEADPVRLAQVVSNLLNNAAKYTDEGGCIALTVERSGGEALVRVRDNGAGIPPDMLPRIFELFTQVDRTLDRAQGGLGIGLTLVKRLVDLHGGRVTAASEGDGKGSEFVVHLPLSGKEAKSGHG